MSKNSERRKRLDYIPKKKKTADSVVIEELTKPSSDIPRDAKGRILPGYSGNPDKINMTGPKNYFKRLEDALAAIEAAKYKKSKGSKRRALTLFDRFIERAFKDDKVLVAAMKKFVPDKEKSEVEILEPIRLVIEHVRKKD